MRGEDDDDGEDEGDGYGEVRVVGGGWWVVGAHGG